MLRSYLKATLRTVSLHRSLTFVNAVGLGLELAS